MLDSGARLRPWCSACSLAGFLLRSAIGACSRTGISLIVGPSAIVAVLYVARSQIACFHPLFVSDDPNLGLSGCQLRNPRASRQNRCRTSSPDSRAGAPGRHDHRSAQALPRYFARVAASTS